jgi:hypothetical protein
MSRVRRPTTKEISDSELAHLVTEIHSKLEGVIFNGGFETLSQNVQNIDRTLREAIDRLDELHRVVYEPDDGLFARVKRVESSHREDLKPLQSQLDALSEWKMVMVAPKDGYIARSDQDHHAVEQLLAWKGRIIALAMSATGATLLMVSKMIWDFFTKHVTLH